MVNRPHHVAVKSTTTKLLPPVQIKFIKLKINANTSMTINSFHIPEANLVEKSASDT